MVEGNIGVRTLIKKSRCLDSFRPDVKSSRILMDVLGFIFEFIFEEF